MAKLQKVRETDENGLPVERMRYFVHYGTEVKQVPDAVVQGIVKKFDPACTLFDDVMARLEYDGLNGCYWFTWAGMYHGVEPDGYIHT